VSQFADPDFRGRPIRIVRVKNVKWGTTNEHTSVTCYSQAEWNRVSNVSVAYGYEAFFMVSLTLSFIRE